MRGSIILSPFLLVSFLLLNGCGVASQADTAAFETETQLIQTTMQTTTSTIIITTTATAPPTTTPPMVTNSQPASFSVSGLTIDPRAPATGALFSISITVTNTGGSQGDYEASLYIDELLIDEFNNVTIVSTKTFNKSEIIAAGESKNIAFDSLSLEPGIYTVTIGSLVDYIEVGC